MKPIFMILPLFILFACSESQQTSNGDSDMGNEDTTAIIDSTPEPEKEREPVTGPFAELGCCKEEVYTKTTDCCCDAVAEKYEDLLRNDYKTLLKISQTDIVLNYCREKNPQVFDEIDEKVENENKKNNENEKEEEDYSY